MKAFVSIDRFVPVAKVIALAIVATMTGCAGQSGPGRSPSTPYKGETPWNISSTDRESQTAPHRTAAAVDRA